uniref:Dienelactone hydrolase domain-containing protein n=1 Tax=Chrysotila carterae TaxID=13221 RepID=A0A7S4BVB6_CHRCT
MEASQPLLRVLSLAALRTSLRARLSKVMLPIHQTLLAYSQAQWSSISGTARVRWSSGVLSNLPTPALLPSLWTCMDRASVLPAVRKPSHLWVRHAAVLEIVRRGYPGVVAAAAFHPSTTNLTATIPPTMTENVQIHYPELEPAGDEGLAFFEEELRYGEAMGWTTFKYGGASHGFTDPTNAVYDAKQSRLSHEYYHALHYELGLVEHKDSHYDTVGLACDPSRPNMCGDYSCTCSASSRRHLLFSTAPSVCTCA